MLVVRDRFRSILFVSLAVVVITMGLTQPKVLSLVIGFELPVLLKGAEIFITKEVTVKLEA